MRQLDLRVQNLDCENDASKLQRALGNIPNVEVVKIFSSAGKIRLLLDENHISQSEIALKLGEIGFPVLKDQRESGPPTFYKNPKVLASFASGVLLCVGWLLSKTGQPMNSTLIFATSVLIGGYYFGREAVEELLFERKIGIELLMSVAAVAAFFMGEPVEASMLVFLYSISEALEGYTESKTRSAIRALMDLTPKTALIIREGKEIEIPVENLQIGDRFIVKPGQSIPTDGTILKGKSNLNQAPVTGESVPVEKSVGDTVFAGSINGEGSFEAQVTKSFSENTISRIIHLVEEAQERKGNAQQFIERFGAWYSPLVLTVGILIAFSPLLSGGFNQEWVTRAIVFIVAAAPCALVISVPITLVSTLGTGARNGVLIKGGAFLEQLAKVKVIALDKTGTITIGKPEITDIVMSNNGPSEISEREFLAVAYGIEARSQHPLAHAIVQRARKFAIEPAEIEEFQSLTGVGAKGKYKGNTVVIAKPDFFKKSNGTFNSNLIESVRHLQSEGKTVVGLGTEEKCWGLIGIRDQVRENAPEAIRLLHSAGITKVAMLTGDSKLSAEVIARAVGIDEIHAELKPEDKVERVKMLTQTYGPVAMVGDGVNDAPALAESAVGIAMGAAGTDVALETADVALMGDDLNKLVYALKLASRNQTVVRQNLILSALVISVLVVGALLGKFSLTTAVIGHELSEFIVILSGLRMLRT